MTTRTLRIPWPGRRMTLALAALSATAVWDIVKFRADEAPEFTARQEAILRPILSAPDREASS